MIFAHHRLVPVLWSNITESSRKKQDGIMFIFVLLNFFSSVSQCFQSHLCFCPNPLFRLLHLYSVAIYSPLLFSFRYRFSTIYLFRCCLKVALCVWQSISTYFLYNEQMNQFSTLLEKYSKHLQIRLTRR